MPQSRACDGCVVQIPLRLWLQHLYKLLLLRLARLPPPPPMIGKQVHVQKVLAWVTPGRRSATICICVGYLEEKLARVGESNVGHFFRAAAVLAPSRVPATGMEASSTNVGGACWQCGENAKGGLFFFLGMCIDRARPKKPPWHSILRKLWKKSRRITHLLSVAGESPSCS